MSEPQDTNPKKQYGMAKPSACFIPPSAIVHLSTAMGEGAGKYGFFNWRDTNVDVTTYYSAALRHWMLFFSGEDHDPKTGLHHLAYAMACAAIILDAQEGKTLADDRPKRTVDLGALIDQFTKAINAPPADLWKEGFDKAKIDQSWADAANEHRCGTDGCDHSSGCAVHNMPAMPNGPCDCGFDNLVRHSR